jgi:hypothetical protein
VTVWADEPTLGNVQRAYPQWRCWRATSGLYHARLSSTDYDEHTAVKGEDPLDLRDQIRRAESLRRQ